MSLIKQLVKNKNFKSFVLIVGISNVGNIFFQKIISLVLIEKGVTQELLTNIGSILIPVELLISFYLSNLKQNFLKIFIFGNKYLIFVYIAELLFVYFYDVKSLSTLALTIYIFSISFSKTCLVIAAFTGICGFFHKVSDNTIGATYITALNSVNNLSWKWPGIFVFSLVDVMGYEKVGILSLLYCVVYVYSFEASLNKFDVSEESEWKINQASAVNVSDKKA